MEFRRYFEPSSDQVNKPKTKKNCSEISSYHCQCSGSSQIPRQIDIIEYHLFLSLYKIVSKYQKTELHIYDTENKREEVKILDIKLRLDGAASITQLPNGELFCYGNLNSGITLIIDRSYQVRMLPFGTPCFLSSAIYFNNNIYCFGGKYPHRKVLALSMKFDLVNSRWINLALLPSADYDCHSVLFNGNILISGVTCKNLWLYSIEIDSFSIIPYDFAEKRWKIIINVERLYLIEWIMNGLIYESEDEYHWQKISKLEELVEGDNTYCLYNKGKIYISTWKDYYKFDLKKKVFLSLSQQK